MEFSAIKDLYIGSIPVQSAWLNGSKVWGRKSIRDAMILWYDLKKQGATNESMATTPTLIDHSGNGHDATCYNFAWSGMSGVGGYATNFSKIDSTLIDSDIYTLTDNKLIINQLSSTVKWLLIKNSNNKGIPKSTCKVTGLENSGINLIYYYMDEINVRSGVNLTEGLNELPESILFPDATSGTQIGLYASNIPTNTNIDLTIELLPLYPHALVSDGVDDYCLVEGLPTLNDYTFFVDTSLPLNDLTSSYSRLVGKYDGNDKNDFLLFSLNNKTLPTNHGIVSFNRDDVGSANSITLVNGINVATKNTFNGIDLDIVGDNYNDRDKLVFFVKENNGTISDMGTYALKTFILFNRTLTPEEIEWVKTNLIETEQ